MTSTDETTPVTARQVSAGTQDVRFATAMTGGVSLAVWMGGVARELNLLEQASRERESFHGGEPLPPVAPAPGNTDPTTTPLARAGYVRLLELLDLTVNTDILSGTSAGGMNAALLAFTRSRNLDLSILRDVWLDTGSFDRLLRDPSEKSPPSLLQGDGVLLDGLNTGIAKLAGMHSNVTLGASPQDPRTTVFITTTLLAGETSRFSDSFGTLVQDVEHRGLFRFDETDLVLDQNRAALALAARSTASFPAAFEPAFLPCGDDDADELHPNMAPFSNITRTHFAADGGLLMNRPIKPLIEEVFTRSAERQVRRVLLYVVPSPGDAPDPSTAPPATKLQEPLTFVGALAKDLAALLGQSISAELRAIRQHNDTVDGMADARRRVAELGALLRTDQHLLQVSSLANYRAREAHSLAGPTVTALMRAITTMPAHKMPTNWGEALAPGSTGQDDCTNAVAAVISSPWPETVPGFGDTGALAPFGQGPFDGGKATALAMLRAGWLLARNDTDRGSLMDATASVHEAFGRTVEPNLATSIADRIAVMSPQSTVSLRDFAADVEHKIEEDRTLGGALGPAWHALGTVVAEIAPLLQELRDAPLAATALAADRHSAQEELGTYLAYLRLPAWQPGDAAVDASWVASRLFELHVVTRTTLASAAATEQRVELVQVSADTRSALSAHKSAKDKLTGMQFHHFGAFYKSSWRANDWMWGRIDGAGWLVHVLLDPRRVQVITEMYCPPGVDEKAEWFATRVAQYLPTVGACGPEVLKDLAFLDDPAHHPLPKSLPNVSMWIARPFQQRIAVEELPVIASEVLVTPSSRAATWALEVLQTADTPQSAVAATRGAVAALQDGHWSREQKAARQGIPAEQASFAVPPAAEDELVALLDACPVPTETLANEAGEPLFTRTVTKAVAVAAAATSEAEEMPAPLKPTFAAVRRVTFLGYQVAKVNRGSRRRIMLTGLLLVAIGLALMIYASGALGAAGIAVTAAGVYVLVLVTSRNWKGPLAVVGGLAATAAIVFGLELWCNDELRTWLFETPKNPEHQGWVSRAALPWLLTPGWRAAAVWAGIVLVFTGLVVWIVISGKTLRKTRKKLKDARAAN
jgi:patatin-related protein